MSAIGKSSSNIKRPPGASAITDGVVETGNEAGQSISYNSAKSNTAGLAVTAASEVKPGLKGQGIAVSRGGGSFSTVQEASSTTRPK